MVFCVQNCSDLLWEKIVLVIKEKLWKFESNGREFANFLRLLEQFIQAVKDMPFMYKGGEFDSKL